MRPRVRLDNRNPWYDKMPKLKSITVLLCDFSTKNDNFLLSLFVVEVMFNLQPKFYKVLSTVIKIVYCSILHFEMFINSLNVESKI